MALQVMLLWFSLFIGGGNLDYEDTPVDAYQKPKKVYIACWKYNKPYTFINKDNQAAGIFVDLWNKWSERTGIDVEYKFYNTLRESVSAVINKDAEIHSGLRINKIRQQYLDFVERRFFPGRLAIFYYKSNAPTTLNNIGDEKIGIVNWSYTHSYIKDNFPAVNIVTYDDREKMIEDLINKKIRAFISNEPSVLKLLNSNNLSLSIKKTPGFYIEKDFYIAVNKANSDIVPFIYSGLIKLNQNDFVEAESRYINSSSSKYYFLNSSGIDLSKNETEWLNNTDKIIIGYRADNPPVEFYNDKLLPRGIIKDIVEELNNNINLNIEYKCIKKEHLKDIKKYIKNGTYDIVPISTIDHDNFCDSLMTTQCFADFDIVTATNKDNITSDYINFKNKSIACVDKQLYILLNNLYPATNIIRVKSCKEGLGYLINGSVDFFIGKLPVIKYCIAELNTDKVKIINETLINAKMTFLLDSDNKYLKSILNKSIQSLDNYSVIKIINEWSNVVVKEKNNWTLIISIGLPIIIIAIIGYIILAVTFKEIKKRNEAQKELLSAQKKLIAVNYKINKFWRNISNKMTSAFLHIKTELSEDGGKYITTVININPKLEELLDIKRRFVINKRADIILNKFEIDIERYISDALNKKSEVRFETYNKRLKKSLDFSIFPIDTNQIVILITDITDKKQNEKNILEKQKIESIAHIAGNIAHDFNNQLMGILGYANLLKEQLKSSDFIEYTSMIIKAAQKSSELTNQLLAFSRKGKYRSVKVDINNIINGIIHIIKVKNPDLNIYHESKAKNHNILGEPQLIHNAILNIVVHSKDSIPNNGSIKITTYNKNISMGKSKDKKEYIFIEIEDNGPGIDEDSLSKVMDPFLGNKNNLRHKGLSLPAAKGAILSHNGKMNVYNPEEGGCRIVIEIPSLSSEGTIKKEKKVKKEIINPTDKINILLIDDEDIVRNIVKEMLSGMNCNVMSFMSGIEAIEYYKNNYKKIDVVLLDIIMPEISGKEVFYKLREINSNANVIILSGYSMNNLIQELIDEGVNDFITKPVNKNVLIKKILDITGKNRALEKNNKVSTNNYISVMRNFFPEIDVENAVKNLGGDTNLYIKLLSKFHDKYCNLTNTIEKSVNEERENAYITVHSIKSLAATMGNINLQYASQHLESAINKKEDTKYPLEVFKKELLSFNSGIKNFLVSQHIKTNK